VKKQLFPIPASRYLLPLAIPGGFIRGVNVELDGWAWDYVPERVAISKAVPQVTTIFWAYSLSPKRTFSAAPLQLHCRQILAEWLPIVELHHVATNSAVCSAI